MKSAISTLIGSALIATTFVGFSAVNANAQGRPATPPGQQQATPPAAQPPVAPVLCSASQITLGGIGYTDCKGQFTGNDTGAQSTLEDDLNAGLFTGLTDNWSLSGKSDGGSNPFSFSAANGSSSGTWSINNNLAGLFGNDLKATFAVSFKAGGGGQSEGGYSVYLFKDFTITQAQLNSGSISGTFDTLGVSVNQNNGQGRGLSHASLWTYEPSTDVPEPMGIVSMVGVGLGVAAMHRRK